VPALHLEILALRHQLQVLQDHPTAALIESIRVSRPVAPPEDGAIVAIPHLGGLPRRYERRAA
jgi:hypothetical protein